MLQSASWNSQGLASVPLSHCGQVAFLPGYLARYFVLGPVDAPPLILLPDLVGGIDLCLPVAQRLSQQFCVYVMQPRGEDVPYDLSSQCTIEQLGEDIVDFQKVLGLERPLLFGLGFGGMVALEAVRRFPGRFAGTIAQGVSPHFFQSFVAMMRGGDSPSQSMIDTLFGNRLIFRPLQKFANELGARTDKGVLGRRIILMCQFEIDQYVEGLRQVPLLIQTATHDVFVSPEAWKPWRRVLPRMTLQTIDNAGHMAFLTHLEATASQIERFANRRLGVPIQLPTT